MTVYVAAFDRQSFFVPRRDAPFDENMRIMPRIADRNSAFPICAKVFVLGILASLQHLTPNIV
jgi:hypothetical protein